MGFGIMTLEVDVFEHYFLPHLIIELLIMNGIPPASQLSNGQPHLTDTDQGTEILWCPKSRPAKPQKHPP